MWGEDVIHKWIYVSNRLQQADLSLYLPTPEITHLRTILSAYQWLCSLSSEPNWNRFVDTHCVNLWERWFCVLTLILLDADAVMSVWVVVKCNIPQPLLRNIMRSNAVIWCMNILKLVSFKAMLLDPWKHGDISWCYVLAYGKHW